MDPLPHMDLIREEMRAPHPSGQMSARELGEALARLVWESFSDFLVDPDARALLNRVAGSEEGELSEEKAIEEILIFHMWIHSRALEVALAGSAAEESLRSALDHLHAAVFEDMVTNGTPEPQIPVFEQRVSARYANYHTAARLSNRAVGEAVFEEIAGGQENSDPAAVQCLRNRIVELVHPLRDYLEGIRVMPEGGNGQPLPDSETQ
jgi:hypothetical protein